MAIKLDACVQPERSVVLSHNARQETEPSREVLTREEAARFLRISVDTLEDLTKANVIPARRVGRRVIYGRDALKRWVNDF